MMLDHEDKLVIKSILLAIACAFTVYLIMIGETDGLCLAMSIVLFFSIVVVFDYLQVTLRR